MADSSAFALLDTRIQRFIWSQGWTELRDAQERAIPFIVSGGRDVIVAAATAAGKTEAAFLPALTHVLQDALGGQLIVYISPLKALINDQFGRLDQLCADLEIPVWPWHGDIAASSKARFRRAPQGVLLITPESVEALLCNRGSSVKSLFARTAFFIIDELHAFIGTERGKQLQSLLHRIERAVERPIPRIGLSATLGDMALAAEFLRPGAGSGVQIIQSEADHATLKVELRGYLEPAVPPRDGFANAGEQDEAEPQSPAHIAAHLFSTLRGSNNLVFPNSRRNVEAYTHLLNRLCEQARVPTEFWPHHGSLARDLREQTETALKQQERPATAICTNTLELGIDIGAVKSIAQIGPAPSVASLRQRLGRSGRRKGEPAILRGYSIEDEITVDSPIDVQLRLRTVQMSAMVSLLAERWFEPPRSHGAHLSTLIQQLLSVVAEHNGISPADSYGLLIARHGPFAGVSAAAYQELLRHLGQIELLTQDSSGALLLGRVGEQHVNHYSFYAAFAADEEFRIVAAGRPLGSMPISHLLTLGQRIVFGGRLWRVDEVDEQGKAVYVSPAPDGTAPTFGGDAEPVHAKVRERMRELLRSDTAVSFLDEPAGQLLAQGRRTYRDLALDETLMLNLGHQTLLFTWLGTAANEALICLLRRRGLEAEALGPAIAIGTSRQSLTRSEIEDVLGDAAIDDDPPIDWLLDGMKNLEREKWDWALPPALLRTTYASLHLDIPAALTWVRQHFFAESAHSPASRLQR